MSNLSKICKGIGWTIIILGVIYSLSIAIQGAKPQYSSEKFHFWAFLLTFAIGSLVSAASSIIFFVISEILSRLATIDYNLYAIANSRHMSSANEAARNESLLDKGGWRCDRCGKINPGYTGTCACGNVKPRQ
ncbi:MAG: hypothetical protein ACI4EV_02175 [Lachnospiraceae bacterium]